MAVSFRTGVVTQLIVSPTHLTMSIRVTMSPSYRIALVTRSNWMCGTLDVWFEKRQSRDSPSDSAESSPLNHVIQLTVSLFSTLLGRHDGEPCSEKSILLRRVLNVPAPIEARYALTSPSSLLAHFEGSMLARIYTKDGFAK